MSDSPTATDLPPDLTAEVLRRMDVGVRDPVANRRDHFRELASVDALRRWSDDLRRREHSGHGARRDGTHGRPNWPGKQCGATQPDHDAAVDARLRDMDVRLSDGSLETFVLQLVGNRLRIRVT